MGAEKERRKYSAELKLDVVRLFIEEKKTRREIAELLDIENTDYIKMWVRKYRREGAAAFTKVLGRPKKDTESLEAEVKRLRMENDLLKKLQSESLKIMLAKRDIGPSTTTGKRTK